MKFMLKYHYYLKGIGNIDFQSELLNIDIAMKLAVELEKKLQVKISFVDIDNSKWVKKDVIKLARKELTEPTNVVIYFDAGYDKQTTKVGIGICIYYSQNGKRIRIRKNKRIDGLANNNEAEYSALEYAISELNWLDVKQQEVIFRGDSNVVIQQLRGEWAVYDESLTNYLYRIERQLLKCQITPMYEILTRSSNKEAHKLATQAMEGTQIDSSIEVEGDN